KILALPQSDGMRADIIKMLPNWYLPPTLFNQVQDTVLSTFGHLNLTVDFTDENAVAENNKEKTILSLEGNSTNDNIKMETSYQPDAEVRKDIGEVIHYLARPNKLLYDYEKRLFRVDFELPLKVASRFATTSSLFDLTFKKVELS